MKDTIKIHVKDLKKYFGKLEVLKSINIDIHEGEVVVVIGPSGSGKSTFLRCLNKLEHSNGGTIIVDGNDINDKDININKVREDIGMVFQHFNLFPNMNVLKNIMLAPVNTKKMTEAQNKAEIAKVKAAYAKAEPYFLKVQELEPENHAKWAGRLATVYYILENKAKQNEMEKLLE